MSYKITRSCLIVFVLFVLIVFFTNIAFRDKNNDKIVLRFSSWGSQTEIALIRSLVNDFEKNNSDIKVEFISIPQNYFQKLHLLFASNLQPDVIFINNYYAPKYIKAGLLEDLTSYVDKDAFFENSLKVFTYKSKIYVIPRDVSNLVVYYNKDVFKANKIPYPTSDWTLEYYLFIAQKLSKDVNNDGMNDIWGTSFEKEIFFMLPYLSVNGLSILNQDAITKLATTNDLTIAIDSYADMANIKNIAPKISQSASVTMAQLFLNQKIAMHVSGRWLVPKYREEASFDWDIVTFPKGQIGSVVNIDSSGYAISKKSKCKKEALRFVEYMTSKKSSDFFAQSGLIVPARIDSAYSASFLNDNLKPKNAKMFLKAIEMGKPTEVNEHYPKVADILKTKLEPVFLGHKKTKDVFDANILQELKSLTYTD